MEKSLLYNRFPKINIQEAINLKGYGFFQKKTILITFLILCLTEFELNPEVKINLLSSRVCFNPLESQNESKIGISCNPILKEDHLDTASSKQAFLYSIERALLVLFFSSVLLSNLLGIYLEKVLTRVNIILSCIGVLCIIQLYFSLIWNLNTSALQDLRINDKLKQYYLSLLYSPHQRRYIPGNYKPAHLMPINNQSTFHQSQNAKCFVFFELESTFNAKSFLLESETVMAIALDCLSKAVLLLSNKRLCLFNACFLLSGYCCGLVVSRVMAICLEYLPTNSKFKNYLVLTIVLSTVKSFGFLFRECFMSLKYSSSAQYSNSATEGIIAEALDDSVRNTKHSRLINKSSLTNPEDSLHSQVFSTAATANLAHASNNLLLSEADPLLLSVFVFYVFVFFACWLLLKDSPENLIARSKVSQGISLLKSILGTDSLTLVEQYVILKGVFDSLKIQQGEDDAIEKQIGNDDQTEAEVEGLSNKSTSMKETGNQRTTANSSNSRNSSSNNADYNKQSLSAKSKTRDSEEQRNSVTPLKEEHITPLSQFTGFSEALNFYIKICLNYSYITIFCVCNCILYWILLTLNLSLTYEFTQNNLIRSFKSEIHTGVSNTNNPYFPRLIFSKKEITDYFKAYLILMILIITPLILLIIKASDNNNKLRATAKGKIKDSKVDSLHQTSTGETEKTTASFLSRFMDSAKTGFQFYKANENALNIFFMVFLVSLLTLNAAINLFNNNINKTGIYFYHIFFDFKLLLSILTTNFANSAGFAFSSDKEADTNNFLLGFSFDFFVFLKNSLVFLLELFSSVILVNSFISVCSVREVLFKVIKSQNPNYNNNYDNNTSISQERKQQVYSSDNKKNNIIKASSIGESISGLSSKIIRKTVHFNIFLRQITIQFIVAVYFVITGSIKLNSLIITKNKNQFN